MLHVHRSERADGLLDALATLLATAPPDPMAAEVVAVPTRGMERWLTQRLSARLGTSGDGRSDGVCAHVEFPSPRALCAQAATAALGVDADADPWRPERMLWSLLAVTEAHLREPWLAVLARHLGVEEPDPEDPRHDRRLGAVRHLAALFDRYARLRPGMVRAWREGRLVDASGVPLPAGAEWQARLWIALREALGVPSPPERIAGACARLREEPAVAGLPGRLAVFNLTRLDAADLDVLRALGDHRDVHLFLLHPSPALWTAVAERTAGPAGTAPLRRAEDPTAGLAAHPLLRSWGRDARELQLVLGAANGWAADAHHPVALPDRTLLGRLQADVQADRAPDGNRPLLVPADRSVRIHACHGRARQVEVLRDEILHLLAEDPTLEPRDVIVMCPDVEAFAPLVHATFGAGEVAPDDDPDALPAGVRPPDLRVRLADRAPRQVNPLLGVVAALLDLTARRVTASQVLDLADREPVRRRFGLADDDLTRLEDWVVAAGIRWGLDAADRGRFGLRAVGEGTWAAGVDRVLLGAAMTEEAGLFGGVLPLDVESGDVSLAGRFAELVDRLDAALRALSTPRTVTEWSQAIGAAADTLTAVAPRDLWQRAELQRLLADLAADAEAAPARPPLSPAEIRGLLAARLAGRATRANFRTGHLTVCTMMPMRSVPHRVVCLLGIDDGVFPRRGLRDGDDLTLDDPHAGERDARAEDRQLLLDALMSATDTLVVTYTGSDERTNAPYPPAVPIGELLETIDATVRTADGRPARAHVVVRHPLQPFDPRNFDAPRPWSFDGVMRDGAAALRTARHPRPAFLAAPLPAVPEPVVALEDLVRFVEHPARAFLRQRLGVTVGLREDELDDALPVELDGLGVWGVGQRVLDALLAGTDEVAAVTAERARGTLPPGALGQRVLDDVFPIARRIAAAAGGTAGAESVDVRVALAGGRRLTGTVSGVAADGRLVEVRYSRLAAKHRLAAWVRLLALAATDPERHTAAVGVGRSPAKNAHVAVARLAIPGADAAARRAFAVARLEALVDLRDRGLREPLPMACATSAAYAEAIAADVDPERAAAAAWGSRFRVRGEDAEDEHVLVYGGEVAFGELLRDAPRDDEDGPGWDAAEPTRFGRLARRLWAPLLEAEEIAHR